MKAEIYQVKCKDKRLRHPGDHNYQQYSWQESYKDWWNGLPREFFLKLEVSNTCKNKKKQFDCWAIIRMFAKSENLRNYYITELSALTLVMAIIYKRVLNLVF